MGCSPRPSSSPRPFSASVLASPAAPRDVSPTPGDLLGAGFSIICSVLSSKAVVRLELLRDVVGHCRYRVNNRLDHKYKPRPVNVIIYSAKKKIGEEMEYRLLGKNCEHFVTDLRYGVPHSRQVEHTLIGGGVSLGLSILGMVGYSLVKT
ncbi:phospholipase A and acyltransferase 4-like [Panthera onca]